MPITVSCTSCLKRLKVNENLSGTLIVCPNCKERVKVPTAESRSGEESITAQVTSANVPARWRYCKSVFGYDLATVPHALLDVTLTVAICVLGWLLFLGGPLLLISLCCGGVALFNWNYLSGAPVISESGVTWSFDTLPLSLFTRLYLALRILGSLMLVGFPVFTALFDVPGRGLRGAKRDPLVEWLANITFGATGLGIPHYRSWCAWTVAAFMLACVWMVPLGASATPPDQWQLTSTEFVMPKRSIPLAGLKEVKFVQRWNGVVMTKSGHSGTGSVVVNFTYKDGAVRVTEVPARLAISPMPGGPGNVAANQPAWEHMIGMHFPGVSLHLHEVYLEKYANKEEKTDRQSILIQGKK